MNAHDIINVNEENNYINPNPFTWRLLSQATCSGTCCQEPKEISHTGKCDIISVNEANNYTTRHPNNRRKEKNVDIHGSWKWFWDLEKSLQYSRAV